MSRVKELAKKNRSLKCALTEMSRLMQEYHDLSSQYRKDLEAIYIILENDENIFPKEAIRETILKILERK